MEAALGQAPGQEPGPTVYAVVNCGFWEPSKNDVAIELVKNFCQEGGFSWGRALAVGGGGMIFKDTRLGFPPYRAIARELDSLAESVAAGASGPDRLVTPGVPRWVYKFGAHTMWRWMAFKNRVRHEDLYARLDGEGT